MLQDMLKHADAVTKISIRTKVWRKSNQNTGRITQGKKGKRHHC